MKKIYTFITALLIAATLLAQTPLSFKYQAVLRDARGNLKASTNAIIGIDILQGSATGTSVYSESHNVTTDSYGLINLEIGKGTATLGTLTSIDWSIGIYFIKITVDGVEMGTSQLLSVPYALYAAKAGNGFSGNYDDLINRPVLFDGAWLSIAFKPTTIADYGITDAFNGSWGSLTGKPTLATVATSGSYADLINLPTLTNGTVTNVIGTAPITVQTSTTIPVISMTQASGTSNGYLSSSDWTKFNNISSFEGTWLSLSGKPTTIAGFGITDAMTTVHVANAITSTNITNWNTAYGWGNHSGLYRPLSYVPSWSEITSNPFSFVSLANNQLLKYSTTSSKWENWTPNFLTNFTETDPIFGAWNKSTGINITASQVSDFQTSVTNNAAVLLNTAKVTNATHTGDATGATALTVVRINGTSLAGLATGILKNTTSTGIPSIAVAGTDYLTPTGSAASLTGFPTLNQNTTGSSASFTGSLAGQVTGTQGATVVTNAAVIGKVLTGYVSGAGTVDATDNILQAIQKLNGNNPAHSIGESYGGGIVFYVYDNGRHGLIAATADQSTGVGWTTAAFQSTVSNAVRDGINGGLANTERIIIQAGEGSYAAQLCANYKGGNYGDWYLPSKFELNLLYLQKVSLPSLGLTNNYYWSSTENNSSTAWEQFFSNGNQTSSDKGDTPDYVRAIRGF
ncbi:MAG: DUF1566 domain-containing protein [Bacteroidia bacterium]|nr:DUF1566 domain-containing protein [Bacteroidia bacterium]